MDAAEKGYEAGAARREKRATAREKRLSRDLTRARHRRHNARRKRRSRVVKIIPDGREVRIYQGDSVAGDYSGLIAALVARRKALGLSQLDLDARAGLADGHTGKLEQFGKPWGRGLGPVTLDAMLQALGLELVVVEAAAKPGR